MGEAKFFGLHGFTGGGEDFDGLRVHLPGDWATPDLPGHGSAAAAAAAEFNIEAMLDRFAESFSRGPRVGIGYSLGGRLLLQMALRKPEFFHGLILISASPGIREESERVARRASDVQWIERASLMPLEEWLAAWQSQPILSFYRHLNPAWQAHLQRTREQQTGGGLARSLRYHGQGVLPALWDQLELLEMPVLLVAGEKDAKYMELARRMAECLPQADLYKVPGAGHAPHWECPEEVGRCLVRWVVDL